MNNEIFSFSNNFSFLCDISIFNICTRQNIRWHLNIKSMPSYRSVISLHGSLSLSLSLSLSACISFRKILLHIVYTLRSKTSFVMCMREVNRIEYLYEGNICSRNRQRTQGSCCLKQVILCRERRKLTIFYEVKVQL